jgi:hypothetical protein
MKKILFIILFTTSVSAIVAQKVDSICFHLYTDSLKIGTHNYINVDGKLTNGKWQPLNNKQIQFSGSNGTFEGNDLVLPAIFTEEKVTVKAVLKSNPAIWKEVTIWVKKNPDDEKLPSKNDIIISNPSKKNKGRNGNKK